MIYPEQIRDLAEQLLKLSKLVGELARAQKDTLALLQAHIEKENWT